MNTTQTQATQAAVHAAHEPWYKYGIAALFAEIAIAVLVSAYSLYMAFNGLGGFPGKH